MKTEGCTRTVARESDGRINRNNDGEPSFVDDDRYLLAFGAVVVSHGLAKEQHEVVLCFASISSLRRRCSTTQVDAQSTRVCAHHVQGWRNCNNQPAALPV